VLPAGAKVSRVGFPPTDRLCLQGTHNNRTENAIRPFVVGRKGWLFAGSPAGAETSALLYSLVETAKANGLEPHAVTFHVDLGRVSRPI
jgi:hypothetical protein